MGGSILDEKPDRVSRVWRRPKMPVLCAFCAQPVWVRMTVRMKLCKNRPLRTRTVAGVGSIPFRVEVDITSDGR